MKKVKLFTVIQQDFDVADDQALKAILATIQELLQPTIPTDPGGEDGKSGDCDKKPVAAIIYVPPPGGG